MRKSTISQVAKGFAIATVVSVGVWSCQPEESPMVDISSAVQGVIKYQNGDIIPGKYIVTLHSTGLNMRRDMSYEAIQASMRKSSISLLSKYRIAEASIEHVYGNTIEGFSVSLSEEQAEILAKDPAVKLIEPDRYISIAQRGKPGGGGGSTGQTIPWGITRVGGGQTYTGNGVAFIIDSGIEANHPDLNVDLSKGFNAFTSGRDSDLSADGNGHGTHVAGTVAAINNSIGVVGVAAGATVVPVKVLDSRGSGAYSGVIAGVNHVAAVGTSNDVANMSLGGPVSQALDDAILAAASSSGVKFVLAAGNSAVDANNSSPARVNGTGIFTISAMDSNNRLASFSNFGNPPVDFAAPGVGVNSTYKGGGYASLSGTSMASPHVAGILLWGSVRSDGTISGDKDSTPDAIAVK